jgi:hypothetical protein
MFASSSGVLISGGNFYDIAGDVNIQDAGPAPDNLNEPLRALQIGERSECHLLASEMAVQDWEGARQLPNGVLQTAWRTCSRGLTQVLDIYSHPDAQFLSTGRTTPSNYVRSQFAQPDPLSMRWYPSSLGVHDRYPHLSYNAIEYPSIDYEPSDNPTNAQTPWNSNVAGSNQSVFPWDNRPHEPRTSIQTDMGEETNDRPEGGPRRLAYGVCNPNE